MSDAKNSQGLLNFFPVLFIYLINRILTNEGSVRLYASEYLKHFYIYLGVIFKQNSREAKFFHKFFIEYLFPASYLAALPSCTAILMCCIKYPPELGSSVTLTRRSDIFWKPEKSRYPTEWVVNKQSHGKFLCLWILILTKNEYTP